jgi:outer membrane autotransporter protein
VDSFHLAGYAGGEVGPLALRTGGAWAWNDIDTSRAVIFPGFFEREKASYNADTGQLFGEVAYPTRMGSTALEHFAGLACVQVDTSSFKEHGGALSALHGADNPLTLYDGGSPSCFRQIPGIAARVPTSMNTWSPAHEIGNSRAGDFIY